MRVLARAMPCRIALAITFAAACTPLAKPIEPAADGGDAATASANRNDASVLEPSAITPTSGAAASMGATTGVSGAGGMSSGGAASDGAAARPAAGSGGGAAAAAASGGSGTDGAAGAPASGVSAASGACAPTQLSCAGSCVPNDVRNCGSCGHDCTALPNVAGAVRCSAEGKCELDATACAPGYGHCSADPEQGCETDLSLPATCGSCGMVCSGGTPVCAGTMGCVSGCPANTPTLCGASCTDLQTDASHCGTCEQACKTDVARAMPTCATGVCGFKCPDGTTACGNACVDTRADVANCGGCGMKCPSGASCNQGRCECGAGTHDCGGRCVSNTDVATCGSMCTPCRTAVANAAATCEGGTCGFRCSSGRTECSGACVDTRSDTNNCGRCGNECATGQTCLLGACACPLGQHICSGRCVSNTSIDACGTSGCMKCAGPTSGSGQASCNGTTCDITCSTSTPTRCGNACVNVYDDNRHCGGCDAPACGGGTRCINGTCSCPGNLMTCDSSGLGGSGLECQDPNSLNSCGTCWAHCPLDPNGEAYCSNAQCGITCRAGYHLDEGGTCIPD